MGSGDEISHASSDDFSSISHFPEEVQSNLILIAEWLCLNDREEYMNIYANIRAHMMKKSLEQLRDHQKTASMGSQGRGVSPVRNRIASPAAASAVTQEATTPTGRKISHQSKRLQQKKKKLEKKKKKKKKKKS